MSNRHSASKLRHLIQVIVPGLLALSRYRPFWLPKDFAAGLSVAAIAARPTPAEWVVIDASPVNVVDVTGLRKLDELRAELAQEEVSLCFARS